MIQLKWYAQQIYLDEKESFEEKRDFVEYMASFWNPEGVESIKQARSSMDSHAFADDKSFEEQVVNRDFKNNPYVKAIQKIRESENANNKRLNEDELAAGGIKLPTDLRFLKDY